MNNSKYGWVVSLILGIGIGWVLFGQPKTDVGLTPSGSPSTTTTAPAARPPGPLGGVEEKTNATTTEPNATSTEDGGHPYGKDAVPSR